MTWRHDVTASHKWKINNIFELSGLKNYGNKKRINFLAHLQAEIGKSGLVTSWHDVMTSRHHTKWKINNIFELSDLKNYGNKKRINFLAHLEAEIGKSGFVTSWHDVMTSQHHTNKQLITYLNFVTQKNHRNKKRIIFLSHLEAEICIVSSLTSWRHVEMLWRHMTWHLDDSIQLIVFRDDFSIISENFTNISSIGKKLRQF